MSKTSGLTRMMFQLADLHRQVGFQNRQGTVKEVKGDKMRVSLGKMTNGEDFLTPWLHTADHRGGARERRFFKEGQNVMLSAPTGDLRQAEVQAYAENNKFQSPDHANESGQDEEVYQLDDLRVKKVKDGYRMWLQAPQQQQGQQGSAGQGTQQRQPQKPDARMAIHMNDKGGITARIGKDLRFTVTKDGVKMKAGSNFAVVTKGKLIVNKPWEIDKDPVKDDDEL